MSDDLLALDLCAAADALRERRISSVELTRASLDAILSSQARINAFISWWPEQALATAHAADREIAAGRWRGPLHGIPISWKDVLMQAGAATTVGSKLLANHRSAVTATVVEKLAAAGAIGVGANNLSELIMSPTGHNSHYGDCHNPWQTSCIAGGSSSGSGAAVAARLVPAAIGSDTGGSVRIPAAVCGVAGLKPTYGRVSRYGCFPRSWSLDVIGPLARTVRDCAALTQAIAGFDPRDPTTSRDAVPRYDGFDRVDLRNVRIGIPYASGSIELDAPVRAALTASVERLRELGATIVEVDLPSFAAYYDPANVINKVEGSAIHGQWLRTRRQDYPPAVISRLEAGYYVPATHYLDALRARSRLLRELIATVLAHIDALHFPAVGIETPTLDEVADDGTPRQAIVLESLTRFTRWVNYLGLPALSVPCGFTPAGMPVGCQFIGRPFSEQRLFRIGHAYQQATQWHIAAPRFQ